MSLSQSDKVFGALLIAFVIYVTVRGQLPGYMALFTKKAPASSGSSTSSGSGSSTSSGNPLDFISNLLNGANSMITGAGSSIGDFLGTSGGSSSSALPDLSNMSMDFTGG